MSKEFQPNGIVIPACEKKPRRCNVSPNIHERQIEGVALRGKACGCIKAEGDVRTPNPLELAWIRLGDSVDFLRERHRKWKLRKHQDVIR